MKLLFTIFLSIAAWQDCKRRRISVWVYGLFAAAGTVGTCFFAGRGWRNILGAAIPGLLLLFLTWWSKGGVGAGDGCFFLVSAVYLSLSEVAVLLAYSLLFCSAFSLGLVIWGCTARIQVRKLRLPFLPFLIPAWLWLILM